MSIFKALGRATQKANNKIRVKRSSIHVLFSAHQLTHAQQVKYNLITKGFVSIWLDANTNLSGKMGSKN